MAKKLVLNRVCWCLRSISERTMFEEIKNEMIIFNDSSIVVYAPINGELVLDFIGLVRFHSLRTLSILFSRLS